MAGRQGEKRSRWGCINCRTRRKKCDEARPRCGICMERGSECEYPDRTTVKYSHSRTRRRALEDEDNSNNNIPGRPATRLLPALQPSETQKTRFVHHFETIVADLISFSVPQSDTTNPFLQHVMPLAASSVQVRGAVEAVAAAHLHLLGLDSRQQADRLHSESLRLLAADVSDSDVDDVSRLNSLAGSLLLIYYEVVLGNSANNAWCHLQGAKILLEYNHDNAAATTPCFTFFAKVFEYFNVMLALSMGRRPLRTSSGDHIADFSEGIDPVFGYAGSLWPLMHRLANLVGRIRQGEDVATTAEDVQLLAHSLQEWSIDSCSSTVAYLEAMVQIARAFKFCGLLVLRAAMSSSSTTAAAAPEEESDIYRCALDCLLRVCVLSTPMATLTWPLYVVGQLAVSPGDRTIVLHIFSQFLNRHHMQVVNGAKNAVTAHWGQDLSDGMSWKSPMAVLLG